MYSPQHVVGHFFETKVSNLFDLVRTDESQMLPDLVSKDISFFVEVKASSYSNGGVIKRDQLHRFRDDINRRRFYAFAYHSITRNMQQKFPSEAELIDALEIKSLYLVPFSIVLAHFENSHKRDYMTQFFSQLRESRAESIFRCVPETWIRLGLNREEYKMSAPHEKVKIITRNGNLEKEILASLHPEFL